MTIDRTGPDVASWRRVNISPVERAGRIILGVGAIAGGVLLLIVATSGFAMVIEMLLVIAGVDLLVTGAIGHCPLYQRLGHRPRALRSS
ncbi:MAG: DUF2892 domain-containing protein [Actinomycetota bacterium]